MAALAAFLHDMGKLGEFQEYMQDILKSGGTARQRRIDHSSAGGRLLEEMTNEAFVSKLVGTARAFRRGAEKRIWICVRQTAFLSDFSKRRFAEAGTGCAQGLQAAF